MDKKLEQLIHEVEERHWWYRGRRRVLAQVMRRLDLRPGVEILDAGCGSGRNMVELARLGGVVGLDIAEACVEWARARGVGEVVQGSLTELPFPADSFDVAVCLDVLEHVEDDVLALRSLRRVVRPGGVLLVSVPAYQSLWSEHDVVNHHKRRYTHSALAAVAVEAGWSPVWTSYFNTFLLPAAAAYRRLSRLWRPTDDPISDLHRTTPRLNSTLELPLRIEARMIGSGLRLPAGLSLVMVLRAPAGSPRLREAGNEPCGSAR